MTSISSTAVAAHWPDRQTSQAPPARIITLSAQNSSTRGVAETAVKLATAMPRLPYSPDCSRSFLRSESQIEMPMKVATTESEKPIGIL